MAIETEIAWSDSTANPVVGCEGCELHCSEKPEDSTCYAANLVGRYAGHKGWPKSFDIPEFFPGRIEKVLKWPNLPG